MILWKWPSFSLEKNKSGIHTLDDSVNVKYFKRPETIAMQTILTCFAGDMVDATFYLKLWTHHLYRRILIARLTIVRGMSAELNIPIVQRIN